MILSNNLYKDIFLLFQYHLDDIICRPGGKRMNIEQIDNSRIIISLGNKDMENFSITFENLNLSDMHSRKVLKEILFYASSKTGISFKDKKVFIEAMQYENGCILLLTLKIKKRKIYYIKNYSDSYIFAFDCVDSFLNCIKAIYNMNGNRYFSSAFVDNNIYYLAIQPTSILKDKYIKTISEFSTGTKKGKINLEILKEHANMILSKNAVETIGKRL